MRRECRADTVVANEAMQATVPDPLPSVTTVVGNGLLTGPIAGIMNPPSRRMCHRRDR